MVANPRPGTSDGPVLSTRTGRELLALFDSLTHPRPWRLNSRPYPVAVLEATTADVDAGEYLDALERAAADAGIPHIRPDLSAIAEDAELTLLDTMSMHTSWDSIRPQFGRFRFPRSDFVKSLEQAAAKVPPGSASAAQRAVAEWHSAASLFPWSRRTRRSAKAPMWWSAAAAALTVVFGGIAQGLADKARAPVLITITLVLLAAILLGAGLMTRRVWLPVLSRVGFGTRYRWFASSSFFAVLGDDRLRRVFERLVAPDADEYRLQLKTFAFLEDLRAGHRKLSPTLRGFKRPTPPVVLLRGITVGNGGIELLSAMSDIRSRRSELHPLLVIGSVGHDHRDDLEALAPAADERDAPLDRYADWEASLGTAQAPSRQVRLPWVLRLPIPYEPPGRVAPAPLKMRRRPRWTWLWSLRSAVVAVILVVVLGTYGHDRLTAAYCHVGFPFAANTDTWYGTDADHRQECVGVSTGGVPFEGHGASTSLDGFRRRPDPAHIGGAITLGDLQSRIDAENRRVLSLHQPYVTVLYAGILTTATGHESSAVSSIRELAGAYLAQAGNNGTESAGATGNPLKIRLLAVNLGENMYFSEPVTDRILDIARRDPTVVGVVGMDRNTDASQKAITRLSDAGLAVVDAVNSSDRMPALAHYYGLASTDRDEAMMARRAFTGRIHRMMIVSRDPGPTRDRYSPELAADAKEALAPESSTSITYGPGDIANQVGTACAAAGDDPYDVVYFAGRTEDLSGLLLGGLTSCKKPLTVVGGDEVSRSTFGTGPHDILLPSGIKVFYTSFAYLPNLTVGGRDSTNAFFGLARNVIGVRPAQYSLLADGQMALAYDTASAVGQAAQQAFASYGLNQPGIHPIPGTAAVSSGSVLLGLRQLRMPAQATGDIVLSPGDHIPGGPGNRGLTLIEVVPGGNTPKQHPVCGRLNGGARVPGLPRC